MSRKDSRVFRFLRSRKLAVGLITTLVAYSFVGTLVPQGASGSDGVTKWAASHASIEGIVAALGLHQAFTTPAFLLLAALLTLATGACAIERTSRALRLSRQPATLTEGDARRLRVSPADVIAVGHGADRAQVLEAVASTLGRRGFHVRTGPSVVEGTAGGWGVWGSPVFHWSLVALFIVVGAGQATRAEGLMGLMAGQAVRDAPDGYLQFSAGPLFRSGFTGLELRVEDILPDLKVSGVSRGPVPLVALLRNGSPVKTQRVYANSPLRYGALLVHMKDTGLAAAFSVESSGGAQASRLPFLLRFASDESSTTMPHESSLVGESGRGVVDVRLRMPVALDTSGAQVKAVPASPVSLIETAPAGTDDYGPPVALRLGEGIALPQGQWLRFISADDWVLLSVANDWSVPYMYAFLVLGGIGLAVSVLVAQRRVLVGYVYAEEGDMLHVIVRHSRRDPAFMESVHRELINALDGMAIAAQPTPESESGGGDTERD